MPEPELPLSADWRIDEVCQRFEGTWKAGAPLTIESCLEGWTGAERAVLLRELVLVELHWRGLAGGTTAPEDYLGRFPHEAELIGDLFSSEQGTTIPGELTGPERAPSGEAALPVLPGYDVVGELGRGGMGVVSRVLDPDLASFREPDALANLSRTERESWQKLWTDVAEALKQVSENPGKR